MYICSVNLVYKISSIKITMASPKNNLIYRQLHDGIADMMLTAVVSLHPEDPNISSAIAHV